MNENSFIIWNEYFSYYCEWVIAIHLVILDVNLLLMWVNICFNWVNNQYVFCKAKACERWNKKDAEEDEDEKRNMPCNREKKNNNNNRNNHYIYWTTNENVPKHHISI